MELFFNLSVMPLDIASKGDLTIVEVSTTLPLVGDNLPILRSARLIIRPLLLSDINSYSTLRSQPEAMTSSGRGRPDLSLDETQEKLLRLQGPYQDSHVYFGIFLQNDDGSEGDFIGDGGVHKYKDTDTGWPEFGYKFKKEYWNLGYATEFANTFMDYWWKLPRKEVIIQVLACSIDENTISIPEEITAWTKMDNLASEGVLKKTGFQEFKGLNNGYHNWRLTGNLFLGK